MKKFALGGHTLIIAGAAGQPLLKTSVEEPAFAYSLSGKKRGWSGSSWDWYDVANGE